MVFGENPLSNNIEPEDNLEPDVLDDVSEQETAPVSEDLFVREVPAEYQELIDEKNKFIEIGERYSDNLARRLKHDKELMSLMQQRIEGESVLDLGSGSSASMRSMSIKDWKAKRYIGVDLHRVVIANDRLGTIDPTNIDMEAIGYEHDEEDYSHQPDTPSIFETELEPPVQTKSEIISTSEEEVSIKGDMLDAISRLEDDSIGAVIISGIERTNIDETTLEYIRKLKQEIYRVLKTDGLFIVYESDFGADENFNELSTDNSDLKYGSGVFEKIEKEED